MSFWGGWAWAASKSAGVSASTATIYLFMISLPAFLGEHRPRADRRKAHARDQMPRPKSLLRKQVRVRRVTRQSRAGDRGDIRSGLHALKRHRHLDLATVHRIGLIHRHAGDEILQHRLVRRQ